MADEMNLYNYFMSQIEKITDEWYESLDKEENGVYSSKSMNSIALLKEQNGAFHLHFFKVFSPEVAHFQEEMNEWIKLVTNDEAHLETSISSIINEFLRTQEQYLEILYTYSIDHASSITALEVEKYRGIILKTMHGVIITAAKEFEKNQQKLIHSQLQIINELSAPIIQLSLQTGVLPVIGKIDNERASIIFEQVLTTCVEKRILNLVIDLSGVPVIDSMVAGKVFDLIEGLRLLGVNASLSGLRPEIAQAAVQLGISLDQVKIYSSVNQAIADNILDTSSLKPQTMN